MSDTLRDANDTSVAVAKQPRHTRGLVRNKDRRLRGVTGGQPHTLQSLARIAGPLYSTGELNSPTMIDCVVGIPTCTCLIVFPRGGKRG